MEKIQEENKKLLRSVTELQHEVRQLKEQLAEKDEQLSRSTKRRQIRTVAHMDALTQLNQARADLTVSQDKCSDLEEKLRSGTNDSHQSPEHGDHVELSKKEEALKLQFSEKEQQMEAWMRQRLIGCRKNSRGSSWRRKRRTSTEAQRWRKHQSELEEKLQEQETLRKQQEEERKQETERLQENFQQLWANSTHLSAPLQLIPDLPVFILPASPVPQETCLLPVSDHALCLRGSSYNLLPRLRLLCLASTRLPLAPHRYLCLAARLWTPPLGRSTKSKPIPFP
ncbi:hypothetical protein D4764_10G0007010 [Takifugu flavidus]|uniref:Uncharacterized protein n=1 Tax=Takifugu flavidus TaxID=433684 RepID=A0A5C6PLB0_9TELE|nr:hypothetical protein D4764_10G0007010 [Takifugu flavidus]